MEFVVGITTEDLRKEIHESDIRYQCRKSQKKTGKEILSDHFTIPLKRISYWEIWNIDIQSVLVSIAGSKGIVISYVICVNNLPDLMGPHIICKKKAAAVAEHKGLYYKPDNEMVHQIILKNIAEYYDAYTYIKPHIKKNDGHNDIIDLRERF